MGSIFRFKKFQIDQQGCAMKINTDGVILGAVADFSPEAVNFRGLDIGTGTGVIAMMLAQRFEHAEIHAIEIDNAAAGAAQVNFINSPFNDRLSIIFDDVTSYSFSSQYDLIVSNPPYFINDLKSFEAKKRIARHAADSFFEKLILKSSQLLSDDGLLWLILPLKQAELVLSLGLEHSLYLVYEISIHSDSSKPVIRKIICLGKRNTETKKETFYIYESEQVYTEAYKLLLKDFFLAF
jgi:tRNA1Val (adenine37-N6)-methyltransferase